MRQKAVSSAPQNDEPNQMLVTTATTPIPVDEAFTLLSALVIVPSAALGKRRWRSLKTLSSRSVDVSTRLAMKSASSASGNSDRRRLYATIPERPVRLSS